MQKKQNGSQAAVQPRSDADLRLIIGVTVLVLLAGVMSVVFPTFIAENYWGTSLGGNTDHVPVTRENVMHAGMMIIFIATYFILRPLTLQWWKNRR